MQKLTDLPRYLSFLVLWLMVVGSVHMPGAAGADGLGFEGEDGNGRISGWFIGVEIHASILSDIKDFSNVLPTFGYGIRAGHRWDDKGAYLQIEHNLWTTTETKRGVVPGALNIGPGFDFIYGDGNVHTSVAVGPSILLFDTALDDAPEVGVFLDLRPVGLRFKAHEQVPIVFDPLSLSIVAPVIEGIPLVHVQYRTTAGAEFLP